MLSSQDGTPQSAASGLSTQNSLLAVPSTLPGRDVTAANIEDAYVQFIFYCNPALPADADTGALREYFRNPPRSGGKVFNTFTVYELVKKFYDKEVKTWTELTIKLGVEPPDPTKDESAQKIAQYGVRLKKWMNSLHVKAFFEYLINIPNDYWTNIPTDSDPASTPIRDGVLIEDDMALRALLPHLRPKRGRKRPEADDVSNLPAQRQRLSPTSAVDVYRQQTPASALWSAHPDSRGSLPMAGGRNAMNWGPNDSVPTPISRWPQSAITPTTKGSFWDDALEPRSATTPNKANLRRGAKNVSSAWKTGGPDGGAKKRGRPPINRTPIEPSGLSSMPPWMSMGEGDAPGEDVTEHIHSAPGSSNAIQQQDSTGQDVNPGPSTPAPPPPPPRSRDSQQRPALDGTRPSRPSISLQVPQRPSGSVRLATPPPPPPPPPKPTIVLPPAQPTLVVTVNGQQKHLQPDLRSAEPAKGWYNFHQASSRKYNVSSTVPFGFTGAADVEEYFFEKMEDRTNVDVIVAYFIRATIDAIWTDEDGNPAEAASLEESTAIVNATLQSMYKTANSPQEFLINLSALAGAMTLVSGTPRCVRLVGDSEYYKYRCDWEYRFGHVSGQFTMDADVPRTMWAKPDPKQDGQKSPEMEDGGPSLSAEDWQKKYQALLREMEKRDNELLDLKTKVVKSLRQESHREDRRKP